MGNDSDDQHGKAPQRPREDYFALRRASNVLALGGLLLGLTGALVIGIALDEPVGSLIKLALVMGLIGALLGKLPLALVRFALRRF